MKPCGRNAFKPGVFQQLAYHVAQRLYYVSPHSNSSAADSPLPQDAVLPQSPALLSLANELSTNALDNARRDDTHGVDKPGASFYGWALAAAGLVPPGPRWPRVNCGCRVDSNKISVFALPRSEESKIDDSMYHQDMKKVSFENQGGVPQRQKRPGLHVRLDQRSSRKYYARNIA